MSSKVSLRTLRAEPTLDCRRRVSWKRERRRGEDSMARVMLRWWVGVGVAVLLEGVVTTTAESSDLSSSRRGGLEKTFSKVQNAAGAVLTRRPMARPSSKFPMSWIGTPYLVLVSYLAWMRAEPCS